MRSLESRVQSPESKGTESELPPGRKRGALMSGQEVCAVTGWSMRYLQKLREAKAVWSWSPRGIKHAWPWYSRAEIEGIARGKT